MKYPPELITCYMWLFCKCYFSNFILKQYCNKTDFCWHFLFLQRKLFSWVVQKDRGKLACFEPLLSLRKGWKNHKQYSNGSQTKKTLRMGPSLSNANDWDTTHTVTATLFVFTKISKFSAQRWNFSKKLYAYMWKWGVVIHNTSVSFLGSIT